MGDIRWRGEPPSDPLGTGKWSLYLNRISTRVTEIEPTDDEFRARMLAGAADEDIELALTIVRRAADPMARVDADIFGDLRVRDLDEAMGSNWRRQQQNSAARTVMFIAQQRGADSHAGTDPRGLHRPAGGG